MSVRRKCREGVALLMALLGVLLLEVIVAGAFHVALQQRRIATAATRGVQLETAAWDALAEILQRWGEHGVDTLPIGTPVQVDVADPAGIEARLAASLRQVTPGLFLLHARAHFEATGEARGLAALVRELTLAQLLAAFPAAAVAGSALPGGSFSGTPPTGCALPAGAPPGLPPLALADTAGWPSALPLPRAPDVAAPAGLQLGTLREEPPHIRVLTGDPARITADAGPALWLVSGNLVVDAGVQLQGLLLVQGDLRLEAGAAIRGAVRTGRLDVGGGRVEYDPCALDSLFASVSALRGPVRAATHWWIPDA